MLESRHEQCVNCMRATGFNPAFYNATFVSPQQQAYNAGPHIVYLAHFGCSLIKVGITHERRGIRRLLEQGARMAVVLARFEDAHGARSLEALVAGEFDVAETVRGARKRRLLGAAFKPKTAQRELLATVECIANLREDVGREPEVLSLDGHYGLPALWEGDPVDISMTVPLAISGTCLGMVGDILVMAGPGAQSPERFMCSMRGFSGRAMEVSTQTRPNQATGQMRLQF
jgi:hypothetical protein